MPRWLRGDDQAIVAKESAEFAAAGVPQDLAYMVASGLYQYSLLDVIDIADITEREPAEVADTYFALMDYLGTDGLLTAVSGLPRDDRWHALARWRCATISTDRCGRCVSMCWRSGRPMRPANRRSPSGSRSTAPGCQARRTLTEIRHGDARDLATLSVAARQIRSMTRTSGTGTSS